MSYDFIHGPDDDTVILVLTVRDTGHGMTKEQLNKLFDEYSRFERRESYITEGTGLGLAITRRLVSLMDGEIHVESEPDVGSTFEVRLPQGVVDNGVLGKEITKSLGTFSYTDNIKRERRKFIRETMPYGKVLIVDDVETNRYVAVGLMKLYKLQIETAVSGFEAIEKINSGKVYDIVFMDHMMPGMDGIEATAKLRESGYTYPIVALTANVVVGQSEVFLKSGFDDFLPKPIDIRRLTYILNRFVRDKQRQEAIDADRREAENDVAIEESYADYTDHEASSDDPDEIRMISDGVAGVDVTRGLERYDGDEEMYLRVLRSYAASVGSMLDAVEAIGVDDIDEYKLMVHGIKGASLDIFAGHVGEISGDLEEAANSEDFEFIQQHTPVFLEAARKLVKDLDDTFSAINKASAKPVKDKVDGELLSKLLAACTAYNMDEADAIMSEIDNYRYEQDEELVDWLRKRIDLMKYSEIIEKLSKITR